MRRRDRTTKQPAGCFKGNSMPPTISSNPPLESIRCCAQVFPTHTCDHLDGAILHHQACWLKLGCAGEPRQQHSNAHLKAATPAGQNRQQARNASVKATGAVSFTGGCLNQWGTSSFSKSTTNLRSCGLHNSRGTKAATSQIGTAAPPL